MKKISYGILNGVMKEELYKMVEECAFLKGFLTYRPDECPDDAASDKRAVLVLLDAEALMQFSKERICRLALDCSVAVLTGPVSMDDFEALINQYVDHDFLAKRTLYFGKVRVEQCSRSVSLNGEEVVLKGYEYDIFLYLLMHAGKVISRDNINGLLPERSRKSTRNVDTYIKCIRKALGSPDAIVSVRQVGYSVSVNWLREKEGNNLKKY